MFCRIGNIIHNIPTFRLNVGIFCKILLVPQNTIMNLNNVMQSGERRTTYSRNDFSIVSRVQEP